MTDEKQNENTEPYKADLQEAAQMSDEEYFNKMWRAITLRNDMQLLNHLIDMRPNSLEFTDCDGNDLLMNIIHDRAHAYERFTWDPWAWADDKTKYLDKAFDLILEKDPNVVKHKNDYGQTALVYAYDAGIIEWVEKLVEKGAEVDVPYNDGKTLIDHCRRTVKYGEDDYNETRRFSSNLFNDYMDSSAEYEFANDFFTGEGETDTMLRAQYEREMQADENAYDSAFERTETAYYSYADAQKIYDILDKANKKKAHEDIIRKSHELKSKIASAKSTENAQNTEKQPVAQTTANRKTNNSVKVIDGGRGD